ncbi:MAG: alpha/beta hydrolase family protein [Aestuariibacter sp.]
MYQRAVLIMSLVLISSIFGGCLLAQENNERQFTVNHFFTAPKIQSPSISPDGDFVIYKQFGQVVGGNLASEYKEIVPNNRYEYLVSLTWIGKETFVAKKRNKRTNQILFIVYRLGLDENKNVAVVKEQKFEHGGYIVDPVIDDSDRIVFAKYRFEDEVFYTDVYRIRFFTKKKQYLQKKNRINKNSGYIVNWLTDHESKLYLGVSYDNGKPVLWIKNPRGRRFKEVWRSDKEATFNPVGLDKSGTTLYVLTNANTDKVVAASFDLSTFQLNETLYANAHADVDGLVMDPNTSLPMAALVYQNGIHQYNFLDETSEQKFTKIKSQFKGMKVFIAAISDSAEYQIIITVSDVDIGKMQLCNVELATCELIAPLYPWLEGIKLAQTKTFTVTTEDGLNIESYLTIPAGEGQFPVIVMPHGGPIGVRDNSYFSGHKQWLAYNGFAVLQVNYRGSGGFGQTFENSGLQQWGRGIEDDIDQALIFALREYDQLDDKNICGFGSSYGGYSVLMSLIRNPDMYKCAVSFAGVTDLTLLFNKGSMRNSKKLTESLVKMVGSPETQLNELKKYSPVYNFQKLAKPIMLIHGVADDTVDVEHSNRLSLLLDKAGTEHEFVKINTLNHGFETYDHLNKFYHSVIPFLNRHLKN